MSGGCQPRAWDADEVEPSEDPGWPIFGRMLLGVVPGFASVQTRRLAGRDGLLALRQVFLSFCVSVVLVGVVVGLVSLEGGPESPNAAVAIGGFVVAVLAFAAQWVFDEKLDGTSDEQLAASYRRRFFRRIAFSEAPALIGFVYAFIYAGWAYAVGLAFTTVGFVRAAPTARHLEADQDDLATQGCQRSLVRALRATTAR